MLGTNKSTGLALTAALLLSQSIAFADESSSTTIKTNTPVGSTQVSTEASNNGVEAKSSTVKAQVGAGSAKISAKKDSVRANADGSVTADRTRESHTVGLGGSAHTKASSSTTVNPDGSNTTVESKHSSVTP